MPTPTKNVLVPFVLPPAALHAADRLITALMTLVHAIAGIALTTTTPTLSGHAAQLLFFRLSGFIITLIRISTFGIRTPREPKSTTPARHPAPAAQPTRFASIPSLPRRPGWLLAALPDIAPAVAADLGLILADPAFASLLDTAPSLHRSLRPLLRALGLTATPSPNAPPSSARPTAPHHAPPPHPVTPPRKAKPLIPNLPHRNRPSQPKPLYVQTVT